MLCFRRICLKVWIIEFSFSGNVAIWFNLVYLRKAKLFPTKYVYSSLEKKFIIAQNWNTLRQILTATSCIFRRGMHYVIIITLYMKVILDNCHYSLRLSLDFLCFTMSSSVISVPNANQDILTLFDLDPTEIAHPTFLIHLIKHSRRGSPDKEWFTIPNQI